MVDKTPIIAADKTRHAYDVYIYDSTTKTEIKREVYANNRTQAAAAARRAGFPEPRYIISSVNMIG